MRIFKLAASLLFCLALTILAHAQNAQPGKLVFEPYTLRTFDGKEHPAELGRLSVRENRATKSDRLIELAFVRLKSTSDKPGPPIVWLAGGPGIPGIVMGRIPVYYPLFERLREVGDVILLDQRGIGMSSPNLQCEAAPVATDVFETSEKWLRAHTTMSTTCADQWRARGVDLAAYTTDANADDLDDLRQALGAEQISLIGHSYGTVLAQAAIRRHGKRISRAVLASVDGPDTLLALPSVWDVLIAKLAYFASEDPAVSKLVPDLHALQRRVLEKLEREPITLTIADEQKRPVEIRVGRIGLEWLLRLDMNDARSYSRIPALLYTIDRGDYSLFTRRMEAQYNGFRGRSPMANAIDCSAGWSQERLAQARREAPHALFRYVNVQWESDLCKPVPQPRSRLVSTVPALFISGTLDTNTPPFHAEEVRFGFPNSVHLVIDNSGHEMLPSTEVQSVVVDFFKGVDVSQRKVAFPRPKFLTIEEAKQAR